MKRNLPHSDLDAVSVPGSYTGLAEDLLQGILRTAGVIALTPKAGSALWESVKPMLDRFSSDLATDATVWFLLPDGSYFSTETGGITDQNLKVYTFFPKLMAGKDVSGDLVISRSTGHRSVIVASPVMFKEKVFAAVGVSVSVCFLSALVESHTKLPDNSYFYAPDTDTGIVLLRNAERIFKTVSDVGNESLGNAFKAVLKKDESVQLHAERQEDDFDFPEIHSPWMLFLHRTGKEMIQRK